MHKPLLSILVSLILCGAAQADTRDHEREELARYAKFAGAPVEQFHMVDVFRTQVVGPQNVIVWPTIKEAYLIKVDQPCRQLEWSTGFGISRSQKWTVSQKFDYVDVGEHCRILQIQPIDLAAMKNQDVGKAG